MKKFAINVLLTALNVFSDLIVNRLPIEWVKKSVSLLIKRLTLFGEALVDANPDDKHQIEAIARQTLSAPEFQDLEKQLTIELASKLPNDKLANLVIKTDNLRLQMFALLGDDDVDNSAQFKELFENFVKTEDFDAIVISMAELLADKYAKNEAVKQLLISIVTSLVNADDNN